MNIIGAGGNGIIFVDPRKSDVVIKALYENNEACTKARIEFEKQVKIYHCISCLKECDSPLVALINRYVKVPKPLVYSDAPVMVNNNFYDCSVKMERLHALPLSLYKAFDPTILSRIDPAYQEQVGGIMAHLSFNSPITGLFGVKYSKAQINAQNPPRGYFSNAETGFFDFLRTQAVDKLPLSDEELESMMGFIYGWIYFSCDIIPLDIEFTLGLNPETHQYEINVLDFGMTFDKQALKNNISGFESRRFFGIYGDRSLSNIEREGDLLERVIEDTGLDLYTSMDEGSVSRQYFLISKDLMPCKQCKRRFK